MSSSPLGVRFQLFGVSPFLVDRSPYSINCVTRPVLNAANRASRLPTADELRAEITDVRAQLDSIGVRLDRVTDVNQLAVARLGLRVGGRWLEELESQLALVDD